ncbi:hypothetical protein ACFPRL_27435 [Pseudoclavibacter helvolus]
MKANHRPRLHHKQDLPGRRRWQLPLPGRPQAARDQIARRGQRLGVGLAFRQGRALIRHEFRHSKPLSRKLAQLSAARAPQLQLGRALRDDPRGAGRRGGSS